MLFWKKLLVVLLCLGVTLPKQGVHLVFHISSFVHHFYHHYTAHPMVVINFVAEHQHGNKHRHSDAEHEDLPSNHRHTTDDYQPILMLVEKVPFDIKYDIDDSGGKKIAFAQHFIQSAFPKAIWQPPRFA